MSKTTEWNELVEHPLQAYEWGEFREKTGIKVVRLNGIQVTIHPIKYTPFSVGYYPKGSLPLNKTLGTMLAIISKDNNCIFIKCEPKIEDDGRKLDVKALKNQKFTRGRSLFTKYNFLLNVERSEEELLAEMKSKTRYNIKVAIKRGVKVTVDNSPLAFERYLELTKETTKRQGFYSHTEKYHKLMWETLNKVGIAHLLIAKLNNEIITTWILFKFKDTLYYPYGASTREHREVMANNLVMWEAIKLAKKWKLKYLDMWGALGPDPDKTDPWYGFHNFKMGYAGRHVSYIGTYDYVARPLLYKVYTLIDWLRWKMLRLLK